MSSGGREYPADGFCAAVGSSLHLLRQQAPSRFDVADVLVTHRCAVNTARWNRNNKVVASGCADGQIQLVYSTGQVMCVLPRDGSSPAAYGSIQALSWSGGSKRLAAGSSNGSVFVFDMQQKLETAELGGHVGGVTALDYQHDDNFLAVASAGGSVVLYPGIDPHKPGGSAAVPLVPSRDDSSARLCLAAGAGEAIVAAGSAAGGVAVWDVRSRQLVQELSGHHDGAVSALALLPLRPGLLYSAGADGRICLQDLRAGRGTLSQLSVGAPATALTVKEDHTVLGVGTADGVVALYDPRRPQQPLHTLQFPERQPVTGLHWQHRYASFASHKPRPPAPAAAAAGPPARAPSRLGRDPLGGGAASMAASAGGAASAFGGLAVSSAPGSALATASIGSRIPPASAGVQPGSSTSPTAAPALQSAGRRARSGKKQRAAAMTPAAAIRAKLSALLQPQLAARRRPAGSLGSSAASPSGSTETSPTVTQAAAAASTAGHRGAAAVSHGLSPQSSLAGAAGSSGALPQVTPLHPRAAQAAAALSQITPLPGMPAQRFGGVAAAPGEVTPVQQQAQAAASAAAAAERMQQLAITPLSSAAAQNQEPGSADASPSLRIAASSQPADLNITPLVAQPPTRQQAAALPSAIGRPAPLDVTPLPGLGPSSGGSAQLVISPLPGMQLPAGARSPSCSPSQQQQQQQQGRSVLGERTNSTAGLHADSATAAGHGMLQGLPSPLPGSPEPRQLQESPSFTENMPLPSPGSPPRHAAEKRVGLQQQQQQQQQAAAPQAVGGLAEPTIKAAAAPAVDPLSPTARASAQRWSIGAGVAAGAAGGAQQKAAAVLAAQQQQSTQEFSFAAAEASLAELSGGTGLAAWPGSGAVGAAAADVAPGGLRDDILAMHLDMLTQFQAHQASMGQLVSQLMQRNDALSSEVAALRKQLAALTERRDGFLWL